ncbi:hypothetical protein FQA39_LY12954 [Lamprigera yunnana]|nr:hypothetical protein FQA39_LY12954 [Lamprigera yunnana]
MINYENSSIQQLHQALENKTITVKELVQHSINLAKADFDSNFLVSLNDKQALQVANDFKFDSSKPLSGIPFILKDNILENFNSPFDATIAKQLKEAGAILVGKSTLDELAMGGTGLFGFNGSAYAVATGVVPFSIGTDTGDSIRKPASYAGIVGFKPTYGSISRFGVIPYAPKIIDKKLSSQTFGYIKEVHKYLPKDLSNKYQEFYKQLELEGHKVKEISFRQDLLEAISHLYMMISFSEAVSTEANLDGINFGSRISGADYEEVMKNTRTKNFGEIVKKRFIIGSYQLKRENQVELLDKAKKVRRLINNEMIKLFADVDVLILPPSPDIAPKVEDVLGKSREDVIDNEGSFVNDILIISNFYGNPSITLPFVTKDGLPIGINLNTNLRQDDKLLTIASQVEHIISEMVKKELI